ncbi:hypothetical protein MACK_000041 [Theileria orientalis]|uniref:Uncharacterized protein n=1 Tax=Theileria orientalis TaxID=68886 RepID=A0A976M993_THEOR|nr:hypothetical protein MACK_000041 [Theileria orientalis]
MIINPISYCTILTFVLLSKFDLFTCIEFASSSQSTYTPNPVSQSYHYKSSSALFNDANESWQGPKEVLITRSSSDKSQTFSTTKLSQDDSSSDPQHIILSSLPSEPLPGSATLQTIPLYDSSEAVPPSDTSGAANVSAESIQGKFPDKTHPKLASRRSEGGNLTENSEASESQPNVRLVIIDVDNKKSTDEVEYKRDDKNEFDIFIAKEGFLVYSAKKRGDRLWKSSNSQYPIGIAYKERMNDKPLLRVFHKRDDPFVTGDSTPDQNQQGLSAEVDEEMEVIEVRKPSLTPGSPTQVSGYAHRAVDLGYTSGSEDDGFSSDEEGDSIHSKFPDPNAPKPRYRPSHGIPPVSSGPIGGVQVGSVIQQGVQIGSGPLSKKDAISLSKLNEEIERFAAELEQLSMNMSMGVSGQASTVDPLDRRAQAPQEQSALNPLIEVENFGPTNSDNVSTRISDQEVIDSLYGKGVDYVEVPLVSVVTDSSSDPMDDDDITIIDSRAGPKPGLIAAPQELSHVVTVPVFPGPLPYPQLGSNVLPGIAVPIAMPPQTLPRIDTIPLDTFVVDNNVLRETAVNPGTHAKSKIYLPKHENARLRGFKKARRQVTRVEPYVTPTLDSLARQLNIYTIEENGIIYENDRTKYHLTKDADMYTYTFYSSAKCFMIKYRDKEWIHNPHNTLVSYPNKILLSRDNIRIEFRQHITLQPQT